MLSDADYVRWMGRYERHSCSPKTVEELLRLLAETDIRAILPNIQAPTLVLNREGDRGCDVRNAKYLAATIPDARLVVLPGEDHFPWVGDQETLMNEIEEFVTGTRHIPVADRVLATVLFTDIVDSTGLASRLGDHAWRSLLDEHDAVVTREIAASRGRTVKSTGDGMMAEFDVPSRAVSCATSLLQRLSELGVEVRVGVHTGEVERRDEDLGGIGVHIAARIMNMADGRQVLVSSTVKDLVAGSGLTFEPFGTHTLRGVQGDWCLYRVCPTH
jgi:class 3 adenylate cyclase